MLSALKKFCWLERKMTAHLMAERIYTLKKKIIQKQIMKAHIKSTQAK